jgi:hypothetical protein
MYVSTSSETQNKNFCSMHYSDELYMSVMGFVFSVVFSTLFIFLDNRSSSGRMMQQASQREDGEG